MILTRRILPFLVPLILAALMWGLLGHSQEWVTYIAALAAVVVFSIAMMVEWKWRTIEFFGLLFPYCVGVAGGIGYLLFLERIGLQYFTIGLIALLSGIYLENVFTYRYQPQKYTQFSLPNFSLFLLTSASFCLFSAGFGLELTNVIEYTTLVAFAAVFALATMVYLVWGYQIPKGKRIAAILLPTVLMAELVWVLKFWPTAFFVNGLIIAVFIYAVPTLIQLQLRERMTKKLWRQYAIVSGVVLTAVILTSQWT